jgi:hypothetical protein
LPEGISGKDLTLAYYDYQNQKWIPVSTLVDPGNHILTAPLSHFSTCAIVVKGASLISWNTFGLMVGIELALGLVIIFYIFRRRRLKAALAAASTQPVNVPGLPSPLSADLKARMNLLLEEGITPTREIQVRSPAVSGEIEVVKSFDITSESTCNEIEVTLEDINSASPDSIPLKITFKKNPDLSSDKILRVQIVKHLKND